MDIDQYLYKIYIFNNYNIFLIITIQISMFSTPVCGCYKFYYFFFLDKGMRSMLLSVCLNVCFGDYNNNRYPHEQITNSTGMCIHSKNENLYMLFGIVGGPCEYRRRWVQLFLKTSYQKLLPAHKFYATFTELRKLRHALNSKNTFIDSSNRVYLQYNIKGNN